MNANIPDTLTALAVPVESVRPYERNARRHALPVIRESLETNGQFRPVVVNQRTGEILAGNGTYAAAIALGWTHIAATFVDVDDEQAVRIVLADNRAAELGTYETAELKSLLDSVGDLKGTGWQPADLATLGVGIPASTGGGTDTTERPSSFLNDLRGGDYKPPTPASTDGPEAYPLPWAFTQDQRAVVVEAVNRVKQEVGAGDSPAALAAICESYLMTGFNLPEGSLA